MELTVLLRSVGMAEKEEVEEKYIMCVFHKSINKNIKNI